MSNNNPIIITAEHWIAEAKASIQHAQTQVAYAAGRFKQAGQPEKGRELTKATARHLSAAIETLDTFRGK